MKPHVVILGAGATIAAIPNGDKNGIKSPVMNNFFEVTNLKHLLDEFEIKTKTNNLEDIYSELYENPLYKDKLGPINDAIYHYFNKLELPDEPTIYDFLILGLTDKDIIATFNWDPLLVQAYIRCKQITDNLPGMAFLHGNVAVGYCKECHRVGSLDVECPDCHCRLSNPQLLFPIKNKDYTTNTMIRTYWEETLDYIKDASLITIFGYGAPASDVEAMKLLKSAWGNLEERSNEEFSFINVEPKEECLKKWKDFVYTHHYRYSNDLFNSYIGLFPRRSAEVEFTTHHFNLKHTCDKGFKPDMSFEDIKRLINPLLEEEKEGKRITSKYYIV